MGRVFDRVSSFALDDTDGAPNGSPRGYDVGPLPDSRALSSRDYIAALIVTKAGEGVHEIFVSAGGWVGCHEGRVAHQRLKRKAARAHRIRTTDLVLLLAVCVCARPVVLAPLALRASGTLNAGRGAKARRARRRVLQPRLAEPLLLAGR